MMDQPLTQLQKRLEKHFDELSKTRETSSYPIFALEHGLNESNVEEVKSIFRSPSGKRLLSSQYWLLWVIYAAELGYNYKGDEYWGSFEEQTPWWDYRNRTKIKAWFRKFQKAYSGFSPSGRWAEHFSIIAWPITHAILPLYLQRQFAKLLYELRFSLASPSALGQTSVGRLLSIHASHASTRFRAFLEQEELTGQIIAALLGGNSTEAELIYPPTLQRITEDLERVRNAREWLKETRRVVSDRFKGIGQGTGGPVIRGAPTDPPDHPRLDTSHLAIRPNLLLRHAGTNKWSVFMEVKSFRPVAALNPKIRTFLDSTRCRLNGADDFKPTGWLLSGDRKGALRSWPDPAQPLIRFEQSDPMIDHLLESECRINSNPPWLFRLGADGIARQVASRTVRPNLHYIVVTKRQTLATLEEVSPCVLDCHGVSAHRLSMPSSVSVDMTSRLKDMGLQVARTIRVWPAGLPGRGWDGEGSGEWLTTESPCFGIAHDHPVESLSFSLNNELGTLIPTEGTERPLFVRLPRLPAGIHTLTVKAKRSPDLESVAPTPSAEGFMQLAVRDPEPWTPGVTSHPGLIVRTDPDHADLDTFWRNELNLSVDGSKGFAATLHVLLQSADGGEILSERVGTMDLPITPDAWRSRFDRFLDDKTRAWQYLEAATCTLTIRADTLGAWTRQFEHQPLSVRWFIRSRRRNVVVRLVDESGQDENDPEISLYSMKRPFHQSAPPPTLDAVRSGYVVKPPGDLFVVRHGQYRDAVLISVPAQQGLQELGVSPSFPDLQRSAHQLSAYFNFLKLWHDARLFGFLAAFRQRQVLDKAVVALRTVLCGENWGKAESEFHAHLGSHASLDSLAALVDKRTGFGNVLCRRLKTDDTMHRASAWFADEVARNNICQDRELSNFALCLASDQPSVVASVVDHSSLESMLAKLIDNPAILRAARLRKLILNSASEDAPDATASSRYST